MSTTAPTWEIREGDVRESLREIPDDSVQCVVTSPPYWGLRDYGHAGQIGLEDTVEEFIDVLVQVFREVRRVLRPDGTCWINMGDSYARSAGERNSGGGPGLEGSSQQHRAARHEPRTPGPGLKAKDLIGQPWMLAFALRADGWWLRSEVIWHKPAPMPESAGDRPCRAHEQIFLLTKSPRYFYDEDAIREPLKPKTLTTYTAQRHASGGGEMVMGDNWGRDMPERKPALGPDGEPAGAKKRSVWTIAPSPFPEAHFATFPPAVVEPCVLAGTSPTTCADCGAPWRRVVEVESGLGRSFHDHSAELEQGHRGGADARKGWENTRRREVGWEPTCEHDSPGGVQMVLDPFSGAATTGLVALRLGRSYIGLELNPEYAALSRRRIVDDAPLINAPAEVLAA